MLLKRLTEAMGVSGNEKEVRNIILEEIKDHIDEYEIDPIGNLIVRKKSSKKDARKILLAAHMDEVGLLVKDIDSQGLVKFMTVGGLDKRVLVSKAVYIGEDRVLGVIGAKPIHLQKPNERKNSLDIDELYIDIGATCKEDAMKYINIGDYAMFHSEYREFGDDLVKAKALDDRVGCNILIDLIKNLDNDNIDFYAAFTVMEEIGLRGAGPAAHKVNPDFALIIEGTLCYEETDLDEHLIPTRLGQGPAISLIDRTTIYDGEIVRKVAELAENNVLPYQFRKTAMGGNDSGEIHTSRSGCKTITISVPCRYIHSPTSVMNKTDYKNTYELTKKIVNEFSKGEII